MEISRCFFCEFSSQKSPGFTGKVVISDIQLLKGGHKYLNQFRMAMAQIKNAAVDVEINEPFSLGIKNIGALPFPDDKIDTDLPEGVDFSRAHIFSSHLYNFTFLQDPLP